MFSFRFLCISHPQVITQWSEWTQSPINLLHAWSMAMSLRKSWMRFLFKSLSSESAPPCADGHGALRTRPGQACTKLPKAAPITGTEHALPAPLTTSAWLIDLATSGGNPCKVKCSIGCSLRDTRNTPCLQCKIHCQEWAVRNVATVPSVLMATPHVRSGFLSNATAAHTSWQWSP